MTTEQIKYSIDTGKLKLSNWGKFTHYGLVVFLFFIPAAIIFFHLQDYFEGTANTLNEVEIWVMIIPSLLGILFYRIQGNKLKFKEVATHLTRDELEPIINKIGNKLEWTAYLVNKDVIIAKTHPGFFSGSWGEQITILFDHNRILVNSICDPAKQSSVSSMGRNKQNRNIIIEEIKKASSQSGI